MPTTPEWQGERFIALFRIIAQAQARPDDFRSYKELGLPAPKDEYLLRFWNGVSFWESHGLCQELKKGRRPPRGEFIAEVWLPLDGSINFHPSLKPGHFTVWADKDLLHRRVVAVRPI